MVLPIVPRVFYFNQEPLKDLQAFKIEAYAERIEEKAERRPSSVPMTFQHLAGANFLVRIA